MGAGVAAGAAAPPAAGAAAGGAGAGQGAAPRVKKKPLPFLERAPAVQREEKLLWQAAEEVRAGAGAAPACGAHVRARVRGCACER